MIGSQILTDVTCNVVVEEPVDTTVCEGDSATVTCVIFFPPGAFLSAPGWRRDGATVDGMRHTISSNLTGGVSPPISISGTITVSNVTVVDDDGVSYVCGIGSAGSGIATLNVVGMLVQFSLMFII